MKRKIKLEQISVKSFVTALSNPSFIKGGFIKDDRDTSNTSSNSANLKVCLENSMATVCNCTAYC